MSAIFKRYTGFTLAEVLITLLIIGIVAALTIPALMNNIQDRQFKEAAKKAFSMSSQALQQMKQDSGGTLTSYFGTLGAFKPVFMTYFKIVKNCNMQYCVPVSTTSNIYTSLSGNAYDTNLGGCGQFVTEDGVFFNIANYNGLPNIFITIDVNGYQKGPNVYGRDTFLFEIVSDTLVAEGAPGTSYSWTDLCKRTTNSVNQGDTCMVKVLQGVDY